MLSRTKVDRLLAGQTALARRVYSAVPVGQQWRVNQISDATPNSSADLRVIRGCLQDLVDVGLVRESPPGVFQRIETRPPKQPTTPTKETSTVSQLPTRAVAPNKATEASPLDLLGELSGEIVTLAGEFQSRFQRLAGKVDEAALAIEAERERSAESVAKLKQLQQLLKSLSLEAP